MNFDSDTNVVEVAIRRLRAKIDDDFTRGSSTPCGHGLYWKSGESGRPSQAFDHPAPVAGLRPPGGGGLCLSWPLSGPGGRCPHGRTGRARTRGEARPGPPSGCRPNDAGGFAPAWPTPWSAITACMSRSIRTPARSCAGPTSRSPPRCPRPPKPSAKPRPWSRRADSGCAVAGPAPTG